MVNVGQKKSFKSNNGDEISYRAWVENESSQQGRSQQRRIACTYLHGMTTHSEWIADVANELSLMRIGVYGLDRRGSGLNQILEFDAEQVRDDIFTFAKILYETYDEVHFIGLCYGAMTLLNCLLSRERFVDSLVLINPVFQPNDMKFYHKIGISLINIFAPKRALKIVLDENKFTINSTYYDYIKQDPLRLRSLTVNFWMDVITIAKNGFKYRKNFKEVPFFVLLGQSNEYVRLDLIYNFLLDVPANKTIKAYTNGKHCLFMDNPSQFCQDVHWWVTTGWKNNIS